VNGPGFGSSLAWTIVIALVIGVGGYLIGLTAPLAGTLAVAVGIAGAALSIGGRVQDRRLPDPQIDLRSGTRREIKHLSWSGGGQRNRLDEPVVWRLRGIAVPRLAARGIDLDDPRHRPQAEELLGRSAYRILADPRGQSAAALLRCIAALDRLDQVPADTGAARRPAARATASAHTTTAPAAVAPAASVPERTA
jgi:hypothetical protein